MMPQGAYQPVMYAVPLQGYLVPAYGQNLYAVPLQGYPMGPQYGGYPQQYGGYAPQYPGNYPGYAPHYMPYPGPGYPGRK